MNYIDIGLAFLEGVVLTFSPCILPVLPFILSTTIHTHKTRPLTILFGFILSFSIFAIFSKELVNRFPIYLEHVRLISLMLLVLFGLILLFEDLSRKFSVLTKRIASLGLQYTTKAKEGDVGGFIMGMLLGLVWIPCAGPILATVLVQIIRQQSDLNSFFIILAFAFGVSIPMLIVAYTGRALIVALNLKKYTVIFRKTLGALIILSVVYMGWVSTSSNLPSLKPTTLDKKVAENTTLSLEKGLPIPIQAPEFVDIKKWFNSQPLSMQDLRNKVVLVDFWTYSCINCIRTLPYLTAWDAKYRDKGLIIIGIHSPEFEFEKNPQNVEHAIMRFHIHYPVALDNNLATFVNFKNLYWPAHYLIDQQGQIVYIHFGEGNYDIIENNILYLLKIPSKAKMTSQGSHLNSNQTPETYLGYQRAERNITNPIQKNHIYDYQIATKLPLHAWSLGGIWVVQAEKIISKEKNAKLLLHFNAKKVFLVMGSSSGQPLTLNLRLNGQDLFDQSGKDVVDSKIVVSNYRLYELVDQNTFQSGILEITSPADVEMYAFTFGN